MGTVNRIVILHGWTYSTTKWDSLIKKLKSLGFEVSLLSVPGLTAKSYKVWDLPKYAIWLKKELERFPDKVILIGHSNGGRIASYYVAKDPTRVSKLVLISAAGIKGGFKKEVKRRVFKFVAKIGKVVFPFSFAKKVLYKIAGEHDYLNARSNMKETMKNLINFDLTQDLGKIVVPTVIIWGNLDQVTPLSDANIFNREIDNSTLHVINDASHSPFVTHVEQVANLITEK